MPTQMPSTGRPAATRSAMTGRRRAPRARPCRRRTRPRRARPARRPGGRRQVGADRRRRRRPGRAPVGGAQVARAVVEHHDPWAHRTHRRPPPATAGRRLTTLPWCWAPRRRCAGRARTASRSARATALNCASTTWWASGCGAGRPARSTDTCSVSRGGVAEGLPDVTGQAGRVVAPVPTMYGARAAGSSCTTYGRPDRSTAAWTSTSSSGTTALPYRVTPALSPSASPSAARARARCPPPCGERRCPGRRRSRRVRSNPPCRAIWCSMWS